tara:strand:+ start:3013 stop:5892 length:2880 start_codon:yes stop_codon:yes gene_type:complete
MGFRRLYLIYCIFTILPFSLESQVKTIGLPEIRNYKRADYQSGTQNWDIDQDKNGNLYFANNNGLLQFDGSSWQTYTIPNSSNVRCVKVDNTNGRIYVGGYNEFGYFKSNEDGRLVYFSLLKLIENINLKVLDFIWKIHIYNDEVIFQSFERAYIYKEGKIKLLNPISRFQFSFSVNNKLYFQDESNGILEYKNGKTYPLKNTSSFFKNTEVWGMFEMPNNELLIATLEKGLAVYANGKVIPWNTDADAFIKKNSGLGGVMFDDNLIALNSVLDGIIICDLNGKIVQHINYKKGLQNNTILSSFVDDKNNLWLGLDNGVSFLNENSALSYFGFSNNLSAVYASVVFNGNLYVATNQGVFYHSLNDTFKNDEFKLVEGVNSQSWNIQIIEGELVCANNRGALAINKQNVVRTLDNKGYFGFKTIPNHSNFVIGSNYAGFALFEITKKGLEYISQIEGIDKSSNFFEVDSSYLWLKRDENLYRMTLSDDFKRIMATKVIIELLPSKDHFQSIQKINDKIYFQSKNKFYTYLKEQDVFYEDEKLSNLFKDTPFVNYVIEDSRKNLWYTFDETLGAFIKDKNGEFKNILSPFSNLSGNLIENYLSINTIDSTNVFIGLTSGLAHYDPEFSENNRTKPKVFIRSFSFGNDTIVQGNPQKNNFDLTIPYTSNNIGFTFSSPTFENIENVVYAYQLEPFDSLWSNWSRTTVKEYTNLPEGDYKMRVKVQNSFGIQSNEAIFSFSVSPPWYRHYLAYIGYFILFLFILYSISLRVKMKLRKDKYYDTLEQRKLYLEKESKIRKEQYQLEKEIEKLKRDKLKTKILAKDKELVNNSLQVVKKNKVLNGIIYKLKEMDVDSMNETTKFQINKLKKSIVKEVNANNSWKDLEKHIKNVHFEFLKRLKEKHPTITPRELDLATYLLLNMSTKEIAEIMNISKGGVELARYRLRKKLGISRKESLTGFLMNI